MKHAWKILFIAAVLFACHGNEELPLGREESLTDNCNIPATVRDKRGLDGCGFVFELEDGTFLELEPLLYYGTPPLPSNKRLSVNGL